MALVIHRATGDAASMNLIRTDGSLVGNIAGRRFAVPDASPDDPAPAFVALDEQVGRAGFDLLACVSCRWFFGTGASLGQSGGWAGYCTIVAIRNSLALVTLDYACRQWVRVAGWPDDPARMRADRGQALSGRPDRRANYIGCALGTYDGCRLAGSLLAPGDPRSTKAQEFLELIRRAFQVVGAALDDQIVRDLAGAFGVAPSVWELLAAAIPLGIVTWRDRSRSARIIQRLADHWRVPEPDRVAAILNGQLFVLAMCKCPYDMIVADLTRWLDQERIDVGPEWRQRLEQIAAGVPIQRWTESSQTSGADVVAAAWHCWHRAGGLFDDACRCLDRWHGVATVIAGALSGTVHGAHAVPSASDTDDTTRQRWAQLGESLVS